MKKACNIGDNEKIVYGLSKNWRKYSEWKKKENKSKELGPEETKRFRSGENVRLKHVDVRLCQLQDWVRENIISIGTVKTVLNVADLNTKKLTYARRAFLMYFLSQVEYSEGEEITHTGVDEYEKYEQEKKLKEYVSSGQVKDLIRLIQVFSVIKPVTAAVWIKEEDFQPGSTDAMEEVKYSRSEVMMLITVLVLVIPYIYMAVRKVYGEWTRISMIGKVRINSSSKKYIFHRTTCRYVQGKARNGYVIHLEYDVAVEQGYRPCYVCFPEAKKAQKTLCADEDDEWELTSESTENTENDGCGKKCTWCKVRKCTRKKPDHVYCSCTVCIQKYTEDLWRGQYDKVPEPSSSSTQGPIGQQGSGTLEYMPPHVNTKGNRPAGQGGKSGRRGRAAMEPVSEEQNGPTLPESFTQSTPAVEEQPPTYEDMIVDPGTPDSTEERTMGPPDLYL
ncbi:hypothetical protein AK812_SmicGene3255 [Symbiodinium microadriaticum]|uniref:Uncharacterized protein n=1 Tax=Symbiodinium microadriaticum TaxID=2951 RepID=A0A1Q9EZA0_SYMMI|nr:hypothetical protein AK812_SmicGene3255 [Symbiodinium microadriaticum]